MHQLISHTLFKEKIVPELSEEQPTLLVVIDNLRYDQWKVFEPIVNNYYKKDKEEVPFYSILPTATQYARNAIFSGLMPSDMEKIIQNYGKMTLMKVEKTYMKMIFYKDN